jgi:hypothetical protein
MKSLVAKLLCGHRQLVQDHLGRTTCRACGADVGAKR